MNFFAGSRDTGVTRDIGFILMIPYFLEIPNVQMI